MDQGKGLPATEESREATEEFVNLHCTFDWNSQPLPPTRLFSFGFFGMVFSQGLQHCHRLLASWHSQFQCQLSKQPAAAGQRKNQGIEWTEELGMLEINNRYIVNNCRFLKESK